jgi:serine protease
MVFWLIAVLAASLGPVAAARAAYPEPTTQRLIVKFNDGSTRTIRDRLARLATERHVRLSHVREMALGAHVVALEHALPMSEARAIARELASSSEVAYVEPERRFSVNLVPNDPNLGAQTYLHNDAAGINAFGAWDITTGSSSTVVAVVDTGYRPHAGLSGRFLPGYDFVSYLLFANDGDLHDADATDPGDWVTRSDVEPGGPLFLYDCPYTHDSTWHGTLIAGLIAANANDGAWTAGIDWAARILPVRAIGRCYGQTSDLLDAVAWAGGLSVPGVPDNPYPAQVINMSFGGADGGGCGQAQQAVIAAVLTHGVTKAMVASAGNDATDVARQSPADCDGIISVGATNSVGGRALYSNFGVTLTISAPGGDPARELGEIVVLSNSGRTTPENDTLGIAYGTSVAAPMVSGVVALMLSVAPNLTADQVRSILTTTAKPFPPGSDCSTATCGAGIVNAQAAVEAAQVFDRGLAQRNYGGLWWASPAGSEAGWGINFAHQGDSIFASWFTFDLTGKGLWLVMTATKTGNATYTGTLYQLTGPAFDAVPFPPLGTPGGATVIVVGSGTLSFTDANDASFAYTVNGISQTKTVTRQAFGTLPTCTYSAQPNLALATNYQDLWWATPGGSESGWGVNLTHQGDTIFASWFTFDHDRTPMWLVVSAPKTAPGTYSGTLYRLTGPAFNAVPFPPLGSPGGATGTSVGTATFTFPDGNTGTFAYTVDGVPQIKTITRELFQPPAGTVCQ